ncbi:MAG: hypothetical protein OXB95_02635 [Rhodobacteraceae bacterium]|nr:hypothetical protein [Paracoccaceae bacterium]
MSSSPYSTALKPTRPFPAGMAPNTTLERWAASAIGEARAANANDARLEWMDADEATRSFAGLRFDARQREEFRRIARVLNRHGL